LAQQPLLPQVVVVQPVPPPPQAPFAKQQTHQIKNPLRRFFAFCGGKFQPNILKCQEG
jgi:hypothetical protein